MSENRFRYLRHEWVAKHGEKLSQAELARRAGVGLRTIEAIENGQNPSALTITLLARFYGIGRDEMMALDGFNGDGRGDPSEAS